MHSVGMTDGMSSVFQKKYTYATNATLLIFDTFKFKYSIIINILRNSI